ncbi:MAG: NAD(P)/FAD-dependent oxidoreductase [Drouetiella hepatica Uher 2000/2452]|jgi:pyruvate/2-oxoglutarate dehydrogenase complex dihydrolipoamide dehydrogenase (E3) component|uniref:NAD(P)/FAD-dependent oxidoreductase n=1 Tax=Drouetiella hepatica Uher 2000/2452 TaxID=904376 RepID=A0A951QA41_9CYAN|nr:NAD(P)/FAD-dependent oxidoreductase [Drouetiella hepatica Uher 2000/2452]
MTSYDYDLVIVGGSAIGRYAAAQAAQTARVALVEPETPNYLSALYHSTFLHAAQLSHQIRRSPHWGLGCNPKWEESGCLPLQWQETLAWAKGAADSLEDQSTEGNLALLAASGVDVIVGQGEFLRRPRWGFSVKGRLLRSRSFLLAPEAPCSIPDLAGLETVPYLTLETLWQQPWQTLPDRLAIVGSDPRGIELAQAFNRLGTRVALISPHPLLPSEDREAANLIQAQLEAEGVDIFTQAIVRQIHLSDRSSEIQVGLEWSDRELHHTVKADALLLATPPQIDLASLNLDSVGVEWQPHGIIVNHKLQTRNPDIYACGAALGGYADLAIARHEATVALKNARSPRSFRSLFLKKSTVRYEQVPFVLNTAPELARVGLTEIQARRHYGADVRLLKQFTKTLPKAQIQGETTGFCKLIVRRNGEILGAHWIGTHASEGIGTIALAIQQNIKIQAIAQLSLPGFTHAEVLQAIAQQFASCKSLSL